MITSNLEKTLNLAVVGNCQSRPIASIFQQIHPNITISVVAVAHLLKSEQYDQYIQHFQNADFIITQLIADNYPCEFVRTKFLKENFGSKVITIVNLYYSGYHPDWFYIKLPNIGMLKGPMGDYHNKTIFSCWRAKQSSSIASERITDYDYNLQYSHIGPESRGVLKSREVLADVKITDFIEANLLEFPLFFTFNHPIQKLLIQYAIRIVQFIEFSKNLCPTIKNDEPLGAFRPLVNPISRTRNYSGSLHQGIKVPHDNSQPFVITHYTSAELTDKFYSLYDCHPEMVDLNNAN